MREVDCTISHNDTHQTVSITAGDVVLSAQYPLDDGIAALLAYDMTKNLGEAVAIAILVATGVPFEDAKVMVEALS